MFHLRRVSSAVFALLLPVILSNGIRAENQLPDDGPAWASLRKEVFGESAIADGNGLVMLQAPERAEDAAIVPITVRLAPAFANKVKFLTLIIDQNPSPVVAKFTYGEASGGGERIMGTRVRVDRYTFIRAIAETRDGQLYMTRSFIKASGGCSAPASRDPEEAEKAMGKMRVRTAIQADGSSLGEVMIRHPNISGMAIDQISGGYPPARFISKLAVTTGGKLIFALEGGISISEDPHFRFSYEAKPADSIDVTAEDSMGTKFSGRSGNPS